MRSSCAVGKHLCMINMKLFHFCRCSTKKKEYLDISSFNHISYCGQIPILKLFRINVFLYESMFSFVCMQPPRGSRGSSPTSEQKKPTWPKAKWLLEPLQTGHSPRFWIPSIKFYTNGFTVMPSSMFIKWHESQLKKGCFIYIYI